MAALSRQLVQAKMAEADAQRKLRCPTTLLQEDMSSAASLLYLLRCTAPAASELYLLCAYAPVVVIPNGYVLSVALRLLTVQQSVCFWSFAAMLQLVCAEMQL